MAYIVLYFFDKQGFRYSKGIVRQIPITPVTDLPLDRFYCLERVEGNTRFLEKYRPLIFRQLVTSGARRFRDAACCGQSASQESTSNTGSILLASLLDGILMVSVIGTPKRPCDTIIEGVFLRGYHSSKRGVNSEGRASNRNQVPHGNKVIFLAKEGFQLGAKYAAKLTRLARHSNRAWHQQLLLRLHSLLLLSLVVRSLFCQSFAQGIGMRSEK